MTGKVSTVFGSMINGVSVSAGRMGTPTMSSSVIVIEVTP